MIYFLLGFCIYQLVGLALLRFYVWVCDYDSYSALIDDAFDYTDAEGFKFKSWSNAYYCIAIGMMLAWPKSLILAACRLIHKWTRST